eukprot:CAMPEP_0206252798 /NCGR_PEP_ID=MMETSP0047_2-20121206/22804_1 /ASSEMBLY_ACC=CAM_ASM_000192 /TAXON_ID=195065 /ORGANISM="Chroomonas mesostigmatica_cf, Strain CCMP1168" /LENGTH=93 /DNA_ID=CAMNT_0053678951 /DNA_START=359 /DNA_END=640 /DNA_ORIENTATION=-
MRGRQVAKSWAASLALPPCKVPLLDAPVFLAEETDPLRPFVHLPAHVEIDKVASLALLLRAAAGLPHDANQLDKEHHVAIERHPLALRGLFDR